MKTDIINFKKTRKTGNLEKQGVNRNFRKTGKQKLLGVILGCILTAKSENRGDSIKHESLNVAPLLCFLSFLRFPKFPKFLRFLSFLSFLKIEKQKLLAVVEV